jgi:hypothetical protein
MGKEKEKRREKKKGKEEERKRREITEKNREEGERRRERRRKEEGKRRREKKERKKEKKGKEGERRKGIMKKGKGEESIKDAPWVLHPRFLLSLCVPWKVQASGKYLEKRRGGKREWEKKEMEKGKEMKVLLLFSFSQPQTNKLAFLIIRQNQVMFLLHSFML